MVTALKSDHFKRPRTRRQSRRNAQRSPAPEVRADSLIVHARLEERSLLRSQARQQPRSNPSPTLVDPKVVTALPKSQEIPGWLKLLIRSHRASLVLTVLLVGSVLTAYSWTVLIQQQWGREYRRLESLTKQERQLIAGNEAIKNQMAQQAESPNSGLMVPDPSNAFFLAPAPNRPPAEPPHHPESQPVPTRPLGY